MAQIKLLIMELNLNDQLVKLIMSKSNTPCYNPVNYNTFFMINQKGVVNNRN